MMKITCIFIVSLAVKLTAAQTITIDASLERKYKQAFAIAFNNMPVKSQTELAGELKRSKYAYYLVCTDGKIDTLNKAEIINVLPPMLSANQHPFLWEHSAYLAGDTLVVEDNFGGTIRVTGNNFTNSFHWNQYDHIPKFKITLDSPEVSEFYIPAKTSFVKLSTRDFKPENVVYGEVEYWSDPFYWKNGNYKTGYIHLKEFVRYYFKVIVKVKANVVK